MFSALAIAVNLIPVSDIVGSIASSAVVDIFGVRRGAPLEWKAACHRVASGLGGDRDRLRRVFRVRSFRFSRFRFTEIRVAESDQLVACGRTWRQMAQGDQRRSRRNDGDPCVRASHGTLR